MYSKNYRYVHARVHTRELCRDSSVQNGNLYIEMLLGTPRKVRPGPAEEGASRV